MELSFSLSWLLNNDRKFLKFEPIFTDLPQEPSEADNDESKAIQKPQSSADDAPEICYSEGCIHTASKLLSNMNQSVDPCQDFYRFTCGRFLEESVIPDDKPGIASFPLVVRKKIVSCIRGNTLNYIA
jgi:Predicted metalloendopeptidase